MRVLKALLAVLVAAVLLLVGVLLTVNNQQQVAIDLVLIRFPEASIARWLVLSFLCGALVSFLIAGMTLVLMKARLAQARRQARQLERELDKVKMSQLNNPKVALKKAS
ncbi:MAG: LapA family protein [Motiliproteus sp.]